MFNTNKFNTTKLNCSIFVTTVENIQRTLIYLEKTVLSTINVTIPVSTCISLSKTVTNTLNISIRSTLITINKIVHNTINIIKGQ